MSRVVLENGAVFDGDTLQRDCTVVIEEDRILSVGDSPEPVAGERRIDVAGSTVMSGLASCHFHAEYDLPLASHGMRHVYGATERPHGVQVAYAIRNAKLALLSGITLVVGAGCSNDVDVELMMSIDEGIVEGPRVIPAGQHLTPVGAEFPQANWWFEMGNTGYERLCNGPEEFRAEVRRQAGRGVRVVKLIGSGGHGYPNGPRLVPYDDDELAAVVRAAHARGLLTRAHLAYRDEILRFVEAGVDMIDHADDLDQTCIDAMAAHGTWLLPTVYSAHRHRRIERPIPDPEARLPYAFDNLVEMVPIAHRAGVRILVGDDWGVPDMRHAIGIYGGELSLYVDAFGFEPAEALRFATVNPAQLVGSEHELGRVRPGYLADLLVIDGDPLVDIHLFEEPDKHIRAILKGGQFVRGATT